MDLQSVLWMVLGSLMPVMGIVVREHARRATLDLCLTKIQPGTRLIDRRANGTVIEVSRKVNSSPDVETR